MMEELIKQMITSLYKQVEASVPEKGDFKMVYAAFKNPDTSIRLTDVMLKIWYQYQDDDAEKQAGACCLELVGYRLPTPYIAEKLIAYGRKKDILKVLNKKEKLVIRIMEMLPVLANALNHL